MTTRDMNVADLFVDQMAERGVTVDRARFKAQVKVCLSCQKCRDATLAEHTYTPCFEHRDVPETLRS